MVIAPGCARQAERGNAMRSHTRWVFVWMVLVLISSSANGQAPAPPDAPAPPMPSYAPPYAPPSQFRPIELPETDVGIANTCYCKVALFIRPSGLDSEWAKAEAVGNAIGRIPLKGVGACDIRLRQWAGQDLINEFKADGGLLPAPPA